MAANRHTALSATVALPLVVLLFGPTASGKTALALELVHRFPFEIISVDSAQVFIGMDIGTAKPDPVQLRTVPHHLIDLVTPEAHYSAAQFCLDARATIDDIHSRGKIPLLVGGSMLYFKAFLNGLADLPQADPALRAAIAAAAHTRGWPALHAELATRDPARAACLAPNDAQRIQRALEICYLTGKAASTLQTHTPQAALPYDILPLALIPDDRVWLRQRIAARFNDMLAQGLVEEVIALRARYRLHADLPSMRCVGYRQVWAMLENQLPRAALVDQGVIATWQFAKRQHTWLKNWFAKHLALQILSNDPRQALSQAIAAVDR